MILIDKPCETPECKTIMLQVSSTRRYCNKCRTERNREQARKSMLTSAEQIKHYWSKKQPFCSVCEKGDKKIGRKVCRYCRRKEFFKGAD